MEFVSSIFFNVVPFLVVLTLLVYVHEWGHYIVARKNGIRVEVFSIGFGPEIFGWTNKAGTRWKFSLIPLGGYVKIFDGLDEKGERPKDDKFPPDAALAKSPWQRIAVSIAGPAANYILAIVILAGLFMTVGQKVPQSGVEIGRVVATGAAARAGLVSGDEILAINGDTFKDLMELQGSIEDSPNKPITLKIRRQTEDEPILLSVVPEPATVNGREVGRLGVELTAKMLMVKRGYFEAFKFAAIETYSVSERTLKSLGQMITGKRSADGLSGPLGIASITGEVARQGIVNLFWLAAFLSINLGLINLFPIPMLDGGHILFYFLEGIRGKPLNEKAQEMAFRFGFLFVAALFLFSTWNDISRLKIIETVTSLVKKAINLV